MTADEIAKKVAVELLRRGLVKYNRLGSFKKTEKVLYEYPMWRDRSDEKTRRFCQLVEIALNRVKDDPYFDIIPLKYWENWTHERIAEHFNVDVSVISKRRTKLINQMRSVIFSSDFIRELYEL